MSELSRRDFLKLTLVSMCSPFVSPFLDSTCEIEVVWHGSRDKQAIALTFDDCYDYTLLHRLEGILDENPEVHVTFFPTGIALLNTSSKEQGLWQRLLARGHEIGYHGYSHAMPSSLDYKQTVRDFDDFTRALSKALGRAASIRFARPPYGDLSRNFLRVCCERNIIPVMWSANWSTVHRTNYREIEEVQNGDIVIFHIRHQDIENFQNVLTTLGTKSLALVTLSELLFEQDIETPGTRLVRGEEDNICLRRSPGSVVCMR